MPAGRTIGNYVLGEILGRGGMSEVHAAEHRFLGDRVAIKLLRSHLASDPAATAAFVAEATRTRAIDHPGVVRVIDFGSDGDAFYLVMERLDGESLAARLARVGRLDEAEVRRLGAAIADGVAAAHERSIVHRDLKPGNIVLVADQPRIIDFGIAREVACAAVTGSRVGTIAYMAPEQLTGGLVAPCVDIWALGVILYEAVAGRLPFEGFADGRSPQLFETPPRLDELAAVSPALDALIASCLAREPSSRPPSMRAIADALRTTATDQRLTEPLPPSIGRGPEVGAPGASTAEISRAALVTARPTRHPGRIVASATALAIVAAGLVWLLRARGEHDASPEPSLRATAPAAAAAPAASPAATSPGLSDDTGPVEVRNTPPGRTAVEAPGTPSGNTVAVVVRSAPSGASIIVDGKQVGVTPATIPLALPASILVTRAGYRPSRLRAEHAGAIDVRLTPVRHVRSRRPAAGETLD